MKKGVVPIMTEAEFPIAKGRGAQNLKKSFLTPYMPYG